MGPGQCAARLAILRIVKRVAQAISAKATLLC